jgi:hypothetical protein
MAATLPIAASVIGIGSGLNSLFGHGQQGGSSSSKPYVPTGLGGADQTWQQLLQQLSGGSQGVGGAVSPNNMAAYQALMGIPTGGLTQAGNNAGAYYGSLASSQDLMQQALAGQGNAIGAAGRQLWQTALDPNNALRDQLQQQIRDASRAGTTARGIGMAPQAAGIENQDVSNFLMNWQQQQLQRQALGLQGMGQAFGQAGQDYTGASNLGTSAAGNITQSALTPYQMAVMAAGAPFTYGGMLTQGQGGLNNLYTQGLGSIIPYLNSGQGATSQLFNQQQTGLNNFTTGLQQAARYLPNVFSGYSTPNAQTSLGTNQNIFADPSTFGGDNPYG